MPRLYWLAVAASGLLLAACSHLPLVARAPTTGTVVGVVEYDTGLTRFSTVTGTYHQDMCSAANGDVALHLSDRQMRTILAQAGRGGFYQLPGDLTTNWPDPPGRPPHCASFRLRIEDGSHRNEVRWDCGIDRSNAPPAPVVAVVRTLQQILRAQKQVRELPWSSCPVR